VTIVGKARCQIAIGGGNGLRIQRFHASAQELFEVVNWSPVTIAASRW
jgi:hypothetical protein